MLAEQLSLFRLPTPDQATPPQRHILLGAQALNYTLRQDGQRRRLSLRIDERGLFVGAPRQTRLADIEAFIRQHGDWVLQKVGELATASRPRHLAVKDGLKLPLLGQEAQVRVLPGANRHRWLADTMILEARQDSDLNLLAQRALKKRALTHFKQRRDFFAPQLRVELPDLALTAARTRWGSCSRRSGLRINWRLIHLAPHLGDYVVVHELAHLHEMNHGPRFWSWVASVCPDWQAARQELRQAATALPLL